MTALAALPAYIMLAAVSGLSRSIGRHLQVCVGKKQGWTDSQILMPLVLLSVGGGDSVDDLRKLEGDEGFVQMLCRVEMHGLRRKEQQEQGPRWRKERKRAVPSPDDRAIALAINR